MLAQAGAHHAATRKPLGQSRVPTPKPAGVPARGDCSSAIRRAGEGVTAKPRVRRGGGGSLGHACHLRRARDGRRGHRGWFHLFALRRRQGERPRLRSWRHGPGGRAGGGLHHGFPQLDQGRSARRARRHRRRAFALVPDVVVAALAVRPPVAFRNDLVLAHAPGQEAVTLGADGRGFADDIGLAAARGQPEVGEALDQRGARGRRRAVAVDPLQGDVSAAVEGLGFGFVLDLEEGEGADAPC